MVLTFFYQIHFVLHDLFLDLLTLFLYCYRINSIIIELLVFSLLNHLILLHFLSCESCPVLILLSFSYFVVKFDVEEFFSLLLLDFGNKMRLSHGSVDSLFGRGLISLQSLDPCLNCLLLMLFNFEFHGYFHAGCQDLTIVILHRGAALPQGGESILVYRLYLLFDFSVVISCTYFENTRLLFFME